MQYKIDFSPEIFKWNEFVERSPQGSVFVTVEFLDSFSCNYRRIAIIGDEKILLGAVILMDENGLPRISPHVFTQYQGILFSSIYTEWPIHRRAKVGLDLVNQLLDFRRIEANEWLG